MLNFIKTIVKGDTTYIYIYYAGKLVNMIPVNSKTGQITDGIYRDKED